MRCTTYVSTPCLYPNTAQTVEVDDIETIVPADLVWTSLEELSNCIAHELAEIRNYAARCEVEPIADPLEVEVPYETETAFTLTGSTLAGDLIFTVLTLPEHGTLIGDAPNLSYFPLAGYTGPDSFTFSVNNGQSESDPATVTITVLAPPEADGCIPIENCGETETACLFCDQESGTERILIVNGFISTFKEATCPS